MQPESLKVQNSGRDLLVAWPDGRCDRFPAALLWAECPSSRGRQRRMDGAAPTPAGDIRITAVDPVGLYGVNIAFSDGHDRGIYPWPFLARLGMKDAGAPAEFNAA
jgi:DUF971 family protein